MRPERIFIDFDACSLRPDTWPIEVGIPLVSDAPGPDWVWLDRLMEVAELGAPKIRSVREEARKTFDTAGLSVLRSALSLVPKPHRAEDRT